MNGFHGKTPQFYMTYINLVNHFLTFSRSIRTGHFELYCYILPKINNLFFPFNQMNYARWLVRYHNNLLIVDETHPGLKEDFLSGCFGVKRTDKPFSRQPIDLTLEQTINGDAARRLTGIMHFTNSISARQRWSRSHGIRATVISHVLDEIGSSRKQDTTADLHKNRIKKSNSHITQFINAINDRINPFASHLREELLYNISNGHAVSNEIANFLINVEETGNRMREEFITECAKDDKRFEQTIKRSKILNFSTAMKKKKIAFVCKVEEVKLQRDLFGRLVGISLQKKIDLKKVFIYQYYHYYFINITIVILINI
ncbi:hypothetical protein ALC57_07899 [Trachymyrmex cornetzi]|uniref:Uncharacterized protein n=1 Tax=Trachymyrmex cornetzi TaxID=471704 RepID=A0A151J7E2_9HYME|nr:hypothetical protein ALC57_07899 [Trachymyrmex cornetzi]